MNKTWKAAHTCCKTVHISFYAFLVDMPHHTLPLSDIPCHLIHIMPIYIFLRSLHFLCVDISIFPKIKTVTKNSSPMVIEVKTSFLYVRYKTKGIILKNISGLNKLTSMHSIAFLSPSGLARGIHGLLFGLLLVALMTCSKKVCLDTATQVPTTKTAVDTI